MCEIYTGDDEAVDGYTEKRRTARKSHACDCCGGRILAGESYVYRSWIFDHAPESEKCCDPCGKDATEFNKEHHVSLFAHRVPEYLDECVEEKEPGWEKWQAMIDRMKARREARALASEGAKK